MGNDVQAVEERLRPLLERMRALLDEEFEAVRSHDTERVERCTADKNGLAARLEALAAESDAAWPEVLGRSDGAGVPLRSLLERCRDHNARNGQVIAGLRAVTDRALRALGGPGLEPPVYGPNGGLREESGARRYSDSA